MTIVRYGPILVLSWLLAACSTLVTPPAAFSIYDLGLPPPAPRGERIVPAQVELRTPSWLASSAMHYRFDDVNPASREVYAESRWAGQPAEMLQRLLSAPLSGGDAKTGHCRLRIELDEFAQVFEDADRSHAFLLARAELLPARSDAALAGRVFDIRVEAPTANAAGGVDAHRRAARNLVEEVGVWLRIDTLGEEVAGACRP